MNRGQIAAALFAQVTGKPLVFGFTADLTEGDPTLANVSDATGLFAGLPVFGPGIAPLTVLVSASPPTLSIAPTAAGMRVALTQGIQTSGRRLKFWNKVDTQPALFVVDGDEQYDRRPTGIPAQDTLDFEVWLYANGGKNPDAVPADQINALLDALDLTLAPSPVTGRQTLGNPLVQHCWIEGRVLKYPGHIEGQAIAIAPVKVLVPNIGLS